MGVDPDKLRQTIARVVGGSVAAQLRQIMPDIELKLAQGVRHEEIVQALQDEGVPVTLESFRKILYRYRAKVRRQNEEIPPAKGNLLNGSSGENSALPPSPDAAPTSVSDFEAALDPARREALGEQYLSQRRPLFKPKQ